jgi:hypothetical protein
MPTTEIKNDPTTLTPSVAGHVSIIFFSTPTVTAHRTVEPSPPARNTHKTSGIFGIAP